MSSFKKLMDLTKQIAESARLFNSSNYNNTITWPCVMVFRHPTDPKLGFRGTVDWGSFGNRIPVAISADLPDDAMFNDPDEVIDAMYEKVLTTSRAAVDEIYTSNAKLAAFLA